MCPRSGFPTIITVAMFLLTWSSNFNVEGVPDRLEQCRARGYDVACPYTEKRRQCEILFCGNMIEDGTYELYKLIPRSGVADGTPCAPSKICRNKKCVDAGQAIVRWPDEDDFITCYERHSSTTHPVKTRTEQCKEHGFDVACKGFSSCQILNCGYKIAGTRRNNYARPRGHTLPFKLLPDMGTRCGNGKACYYRKCMSLAEWPRHVQKPRYTDREIVQECLPRK